MPKTNNLNPLVSVYVITYNRAHLLRTAIESVIAQNYTNIEIIIVDDASTDTTKDVCLALSQEFKNVSYFINQQNSGANFSRNRALDHCTGKFVTGLDDDDCFLPDRIQNFISEWDDRYSFLCSDFILNFGNSQKKYYGSGGVFIPKQLLFFNHASGQIFTLRERLATICRFNETLKRLQDWECWLRIAMHYGPFKRLSCATYIANENQTTERISSSIRYELALHHFLECNPEFFSKIEHDFFVKYIIEKNFNNIFVDMFSQLDYVLKKQILIMAIKRKLWRFM